MASTIPGPARDFVRIVTQAVDTAISGASPMTSGRLLGLRGEVVALQD
jgi:hypothetical protein